MRLMAEGPVLVGLTGNIATGKSEVARLMSGLGAEVIDADKVAHEVMRPGAPAYQAVVALFGREILDSDGAIDRARLGAIVFRDPQALLKLEAAVHPHVLDRVDERIAQAQSAVVVIEAIKLIEAGMHRRYDALWVVTAPRAMQIERLVANRGLSAAEAALRVDSQPPQAEKAQLADWIIVNDHDFGALRQQVEQAWQQLPAA